MWPGCRLERESKSGSGGTGAGSLRAGGRGVSVSSGHTFHDMTSGDRFSGWSGPACRMVGVGLETKKGDRGAPDGDGLQRRESLVSGDGNVLGGATGGDVTVQGAEPSLIPPRPKAGRGRPLNER